MKRNIIIISLIIVSTMGVIGCTTDTSPPSSTPAGSHPLAATTVPGTITANEAKTSFEQDMVGV